MVSTQVPAPIRAWPAQGEWTYEDWLQLPDDGSRYEVIDGVLHVTPTPSIAHQSVSGRLFLALANLADARRLGRVLAAPVGVRLPGQDVPFQPDLVFVSAGRSEIIGTQFNEGVPDLVAEILSPSNWPYDRGDKLRVYQSAGVPEYWLVDYRTKTIEVLVLERGEYTLLGVWQSGETAHSRVLESFEIAVDDVFRDV